MAGHLKVWYDAEGDFLEVQFADGAGHMRETTHDAVMERVDAEGNVLGFSVLGASTFTSDHPLDAQLHVK